MSTITAITEQLRRKNRRNVFLDGAFAFGCNVNVVARFRLRVGMKLDAARRKEIEQGEVKQECFDAAMNLLSRRLHSRAELRRKLARRKDWPDEVIDAVIGDVARLGYLDDERFAKTKALGAAEHRRHGPRRAVAELVRSGIKTDLAQKTVADVYESHDTNATARSLAFKQLPRLARLDAQTAKRRLVAMLQRRGYDYPSIKLAVDDVMKQR